MSTNQTDVTVADSPTEWIDVHVAGGTPAPSTPLHGSPTKHTTPSGAASRSLPKPIPPVPAALVSATASVIAPRAVAAASKVVDESFQLDALRKEIERLKVENGAFKQALDIFNKKEFEMSRKIVDLEVKLVMQAHALRDEHAKQQAAALQAKSDELKAMFETEKQRFLADLHRRQNYRA